MSTEITLRDRGVISPRELINLARSDFSSLFENKDKLELSLKLGLIIYDYANYYNYFKDSIFELFLKQLIQIYHGCKIRDNDLCIQFLASWNSQVDRATHSFSLLSHLEKRKSVGRYDILVKAYFQEMGDLIEASIKPHLQVIYGLNTLGIKYFDTESLTASLFDIRLGNIINNLINISDEFNAMYKGILKNVPLHQWRNIAHHNTYEVKEGSNVSCTYGERNPVTIVLSKDDLAQTLMAIHWLYRLHKTAFDIFFCDNMHFFEKTLGDQRVPSEDSLVIQISESAYIHGFKLLECTKTKNRWLVILKDINYRNYAALERAAKDIIWVYNIIREPKKVTFLDSRGNIRLIAKCK